MKQNKNDRKFLVQIDDPCEPIEYLLNSLQIEVNETVYENLLNSYNGHDWSSYIDNGKNVWKFGRLRLTDV